MKRFFFSILYLLFFQALLPFDQSETQLKTFILIFYSKQAAHLPPANFPMCHKHVTWSWGIFYTCQHPSVCDTQCLPQSNMNMWDSLTKPNKTKPNQNPKPNF